MLGKRGPSGSVDPRGALRKRGPSGGAREARTLGGRSGSAKLAVASRDEGELGGASGGNRGLASTRDRKLPRHR